MEYNIAIENRIRVGFSLGWAWHGVEEGYDYSEFILYLGLIALNIKYK
jgi:hypothetical protein